MADETEEKELFMESIHDRDLDNDGIPDILFDRQAKGLSFKDPKMMEIFKRYVSYDCKGRNPHLSIGAVLVDVVKELRKIRKLLEQKSP